MLWGQPRSKRHEEWDYEGSDSANQLSLSIQLPSEKLFIDLSTIDFNPTLHCAFLVNSMHCSKAILPWEKSSMDLSIIPLSC